MSYRDITTETDLTRLYGADVLASISEGQFDDRLGWECGCDTTRYGLDLCPLHAEMQEAFEADYDEDDDTPIAGLA